MTRIVAAVLFTLTLVSVLGGCYVSAGAGERRCANGWSRSIATAKVASSKVTAGDEARSVSVPRKGERRAHPALHLRSPPQFS